MDKRGNIVATIIVVGVILTAVVVYTQASQSGPSRADVLPDRTAEADYRFNAAFASAIHDFATFGYSIGAGESVKSTDVWYNNEPLPPSVDESRDSFIEHMRRSIENSIQQMNYDYAAEGFSIEWDGSFTTNADDVVSLDQFPDEEVVITIANLYATINDGSQVIREDISKSYSYPYPLWRIYKVMHEWMAADAGNLSYALFVALSNRSCEATVCCCSEGVNLLEDDILEEMKIKQEEILTSIQLSVDDLNARFGPDVVCEYEVVTGRVDNRPQYRRELAEQIGSTDEYVFYCEAICDRAGRDPSTLGAAPSQDARLANYHLLAGDFLTYPFDNYGIEGNYGLPTLNCTYEYGGAVMPCTKLDDRERLYEPVLAVESYEAWNVTTPTLGIDPSHPLNERTGMNKMASYLYTVKCAYDGQLLEGDDGFNPFAPELRMRFSVMFECPINDFDGMPEVYHMCGGGGGGCFPADTQILMADGSQKPISMVEIGDWVLSYDQCTGEQVPGRVTGLEFPPSDGYYVVALSDGRVVRPTSEHPFLALIDGTVRWAAIHPEVARLDAIAIEELYSLSVGDSLFDDQLRAVRIEAITWYRGPVLTYNLNGIVAEDGKEVGTYYADGFLAHNKVLEITCPTPAECARAAGAGPDASECWGCNDVGECIPLPNPTICGQCTVCNPVTGFCDMGLTEASAIHGDLYTTAVNDLGIIPCGTCTKCAPDGAGGDECVAATEMDDEVCRRDRQCRTLCSDGACNTPLPADVGIACGPFYSECTGQEYYGTCTVDGTGGLACTRPVLPEGPDGASCCGGQWCSLECCNIGGELTCQADCDLSTG